MGAFIPNLLRRAVSLTAASIAISALATASLGGCGGKNDEVSPARSHTGSDQWPVIAGTVPSYRPTTFVLIAEPEISSRHVWRNDSAGLVIALYEYGLAELPGLVPRYEDSPLAPGLEAWMTTDASEWQAEMTLGDDADDAWGKMTIGLRLCRLQGACAELAVTADRDFPTDAVTELLVWTAARLDLPSRDAVSNLWWRQPSTDRYALLMTGRAAAQFYTLEPSTPPWKRGNTELDPTARAVLIDPQNPVAQWTLARRALAAGRPGTAVEALSRAREDGNRALALAVGLAESYARQNDWAAAARVWEEVDERSPLDSRFVLARAEALLETRAAAAAFAMLDGLPPRYRKSSSVAALLVAAAEALDLNSRYEDLLVEWEKAAPLDPEPFRRRIALYVKDGRVSEAAALLGELEARGGETEAARLGIALRNELGQCDEAAELARKAGAEGFSRRLHALAAITQGKTDAAELIGDPRDSSERVVLGSLLLKSDPAKALYYAQRVLRTEPWSPEALAVKAAALAALGRDDAAAAAQEQLHAADPAFAARVAARREAAEDPAVADPETDPAAANPSPDEPPAADDPAPGRPDPATAIERPGPPEALAAAAVAGGATGPIND